MPVGVFTVHFSHPQTLDWQRVWAFGVGGGEEGDIKWPLQGDNSGFVLLLKSVLLSNLPI